MGSIPAGNGFLVELDVEVKQSERNQNRQPSVIITLPVSKLSDLKAEIASFSKSVLRTEAWFRTANELIAAMKLLEPHVKRFWESERDVRPKQSLINVHMMLAGFAIENLCKGYLAGRLSSKERAAAEAGRLPSSLKTHDLLKLVEKTGMTISETDKYLIMRLSETVVWRGRYPIATSHDWFRAFAQINCDIDDIETLLQGLRRHVGADKSQDLAPSNEPTAPESKPLRNSSYALQR